MQLKNIIIFTCIIITYVIMKKIYNVYTINFYEKFIDKYPKITFNPKNYQPVSLSELDKVPSLYNDHNIEVHGNYTWGFEQSILQPNIWLNFNADTIIINEPPINNNDTSSHNYLVTIYGHFEYDPDKNKYGYGHLGSAKSQIMVDKIIYCQYVKKYIKSIN